MDLTNEIHGHRWYRRGRGLARGFFSVRPCRSIPDEGCISLIVSFPSMAFVQLFNLNLFDHHLPILFEPIFPTSRPTIDRFSSFLLFRCSFPPFSYTFDLLVKTIIEQASSFRRDISYPRILYHFPRHTFHCSNILRVLSTREVDTSLDLIVEQLVSANLSTIAPL